MIRRFSGSRSWVVLLVGLGGGLVAATSGCGGGGGERLVQVEGKVMLGNKLLTLGDLQMGRVYFHPDKSKGNNNLEAPAGEINKEGIYTINTRDKPGVAPGWYKVTVDAHNVSSLKDPYIKGYLTPEKYRELEKTDLYIEVKEDAPAGHYDLVLKSK